MSEEIDIGFDIRSKSKNSGIEEMKCTVSISGKNLSDQVKNEIPISEAKSDHNIGMNREERIPILKRKWVIISSEDLSEHIKMGTSISERKRDSISGMNQMEMILISKSCQTFLGFSIFQNFLDFLYSFFFNFLDVFEFLYIFS